MSEDRALGKPAGIAAMDTPRRDTTERAGGMRLGGCDPQGESGAVKVGAYESASQRRAEKLSQKQTGSPKDDEKRLDVKCG